MSFVGMPTFTVPRDLKIKVKFENGNPEPQNILIIEKAMTKRSK